MDIANQSDALVRAMSARLATLCAQSALDVASDVCLQAGRSFARGASTMDAVEPFTLDDLRVAAVAVGGHEARNGPFDRRAVNGEWNGYRVAVRWD